MAFTSGGFQELGVRAVVKDIGKFMSDIGRMETGVKAAGQKMQSVGRGMTSAGQALTMGITLPIAAVGAVALKSSIDFESAMIRVKKTVDMTEEGFKTLEGDIRGMATELPFAATEIADVVAAAGQLGIENENLLDFTRTMLDVAVATDITSDQAAIAFARIANITQMPEENFSNLASTIVGLGNQFATFESEIVEMMLRIAGAGTTVGLSVAEIAGWSAALSAVGIQAQAGGTAISQIFIAMATAVSEGSEELETYAAVAGMVTDEFEQLAKTDPSEAARRFILGLSQITDPGEIFLVLEALGLSGIRVGRALTSLANNTDEFNAALSESQGLWDENTAATEEAEKQYASTASQLKVFMNKLVEVARTIGDALLPALKDAMKIMGVVLKLVAFLAKGFASLPKPIRYIIIAIFLLAAALGPLLLILGTFMTGLGQMLIFAPIAGAKIALLATKLAGMGITMAAVMPWVWGLIAVMLILIATAPLIEAAWGPVTDFLSTAFSDAFEAAVGAIDKLIAEVMSFVPKLVAAMLNLGKSMAHGIASGIASGAKVIFDVIREIASAIAYMLGGWLFDVGFGRSIEDVYGQAGKNAMGAYAIAVNKSARKTQQTVAKAMTPPVIMPVVGDPTYERAAATAPPVGEWMPERDGRPREPTPAEEFGEFMPKAEVEVDVELGDTTALTEDLAEEAEEAAEDAAKKAANAYLGMLEGIVAAGLGTVTTAMAAPLDALRGVVSGLADEIMRLAGLATVESATERLERAQLKLELLGVKAGEKANEARKERLDAIGEEEKALLEERQAIIDENWGREEGVEAIDAQLEALEKEEDAIEDEIDVYEKELEAIEDQIDALDRLAEERGLEREIAAASAQLADKTLTTDAAVLDQMNKMIPVISQITDLVNQQANDLWTRFVPAWQDAGAAAAEGAGAGEGEEIEAPDLAGLGEFDMGEGPEMPDPAEMVREQVSKIKAWFKSKRPIFVGIGVGILLAIAFGWNIGLAAAVGALIGFMVMQFHDEILGGFKWLGNFIAEHWKEILTVLASVTLAPLAPIIALATDAFGIRSALEKGLGKVLELLSGFGQSIGEALGGIGSAVKGAFEEVLDFFAGLPGKIAGLISPRNIGRVVGGALALMFVGLGPILLIRFRDQIWDFVSGVPGAVAEAFGSVIGAVSGAAGAVWGAITDIPGTVGGLAEQIAGVFAALPGQIAGALAGAATAIAEWISGLATAFLELKPWEWAKAAVEAFIGGIVDALKWLFGFSFINEWLTKLAAFFTKMFNPWNWVKAGIKLFTKQVPKAFKDVSKRVLKFYGPLAKKLLKLTLKLVKRVIKFYSELVKKVVAFIAGMVGDVLSFYGDLVSDLIQLTSDMVQRVIAFFRDLVTKVVAFINDMVSEVVGLIEGMVTSVVTAVTELYTDVTGLFGDIYTEVTGSVSDLVIDVVAFFEGLPGDIVTALESLVPDVVGIFTGLGTAILGAVSGFGTLLFEAGASLIGGLIAGILDIAMAPVNIARNIVNAIITFLNDNLIATINDLLPICLDLGPLGNVCSPDITVPDIPTIPGKRGLWNIPGIGTADSVPALLAPGEMVVPRPIADVLRATVGSFGQLGGMMARAAQPLGASRPMAMAGALSVSAPISVTVVSHDWGEVRRIVHDEVDTALALARDETTREGAELSSGIV